ncbi:hypothetical protein [Psychrobacter aquimaris]|uniref:hypothetical protein n=1 Tax=Psychrobacter aquimaris TaxID=292733 RepID=UPI0018DFF22E|nr:hypothetical protein [Psychrobacter aquimaris]
MEYLSIIWEWIDQQFRPVTAILASFFAIFFAWRKIGYKVNVTYDITLSGTSEVRISNMVFQNKKDKPLSIYKIVAVFDKSYCLEIHRCSPPLILKPYESISIETEEYSYLSVGEDRYYPELQCAEIYIESDDKIIKCKAKPHKTLAFKYMNVSKTINIFNGVVYTDNVAYILVYAVNNVNKTALLYDSGLILHEWDFHFNGIKLSGEKLEADDISQFLEIHYSRTIDSYLLYKMNESPYGFDLLKHHEFERS